MEKNTVNIDTFSSPTKIEITPEFTSHEVSSTIKDQLSDDKDMTSEKALRKNLKEQIIRL